MHVCICVCVYIYIYIYIYTHIINKVYVYLRGVPGGGELQAAQEGRQRGLLQCMTTTLI